jgi:hypothetical protein
MHKNINRVWLGMAFLLIAAMAFTIFGKVQKNDLPVKGAEAAVRIITRSSERAVSDPAGERRRRESVSAAAQKWYEELLEKYPDMKPVYRDVPDERNGYLQLLLLAENVKTPRLSPDLEMMFSGDQTAWEPEKFKAWLAENRAYADEILRVAELPDRSTKGIAFDRIFNETARLGMEFSRVLLGSARLAFEGGDQETALRYVKAAGSLGDHFADIEVPSMLGEVISTGIRARASDALFENYLPALANDPEALARWREVIFRSEAPAGEYARAVIGEWNTAIRGLLLPALLGDHSVTGGAIPADDVAGLIDSYTLAMRGMAEGVSMKGADRFDVGQATNTSSPTGVLKEAPRGDEKFTVESILFSIRGLGAAFGTNASRNAMRSGAISILLGEELPVDPVTGQAFAWNAETRTLALPGNEDGEESIIVPARQ